MGFSTLTALRDSDQDSGRRSFLPFRKATAAAGGAGTFGSGWQRADIPPGGASAGSLNPGTICNYATTGSLLLADAALSLPSTGMTRHLDRLGTALTNTAAGLAFIYDRLWHGQNLNPQITTTQTIGSTALTRYTGAAAKHNKVSIEVVTALTGGGGNSTMTYTDQDGNTGQSVTDGNMTAATVQDRFYHTTEPWHLLASTDTGVRAIADLTFGTAATAGACRIVIWRPLIALSISAASTGVIGGAVERELMMLLPRLTDDAADGPCLNFMQQFAGTGSSSNFAGALWASMA